MDIFRRLDGTETRLATVAPKDFCHLSPAVLSRIFIDWKRKSFEFLMGRLQSRCNGKKGTQNVECLHKITGVAAGNESSPLEGMLSLVLNQSCLECVGRCFPAFP